MDRRKKITTKLNVNWQMEDENMNLHHGQSIIRPKQRRIVCRTIRNNIAVHRFNELANLPNQGKVMQFVQLAKASSHFLATGYLTRFADWRFIHRARPDIVIVKGHNY